MAETASASGMKPEDEKSANASPEKKSNEKKSKTSVRKRNCNYRLKCGVYRFGRSRMFHKRACYKFVNKTTEKGKKKEEKAEDVKKPAAGEKSGTRTGQVKKLRQIYPTLGRKRKPRKKVQKKATLKKSLKPGTVVIILSGPHRGKRVIFLKQLTWSGLLLVTGPFKLNGCPLRRIDQAYTIATSLRLDISGVKIPDHLNDRYFRRKRPKKSKKDDGEIFETKKGKYEPTEQRKQDQLEVDGKILEVIRKHEEKKAVFGYLASKFGLRRQQYPHRLKF